MSFFEKLLKIIEEKIAGYKIESEGCILEMNVKKEQMEREKKFDNFKELLVYKDQVMFNTGAAAALEDLKDILEGAMALAEEQQDDNSKGSV